MNFARRMENKVAATLQQAEAPTHLMTAKGVAFLFGPSILFVSLALLALIHGTGYKDMAEGTVAVANTQKIKREREEMAAKIAAGRPEPTREYMLGALDKSDDLVSAWQNAVTACAWSLRQIGIGVLLGVVAQVYVILKLRAHYKKLAGSAAVLS